MANITDTTKLDGHVDLTTEGKQNWISQINAGGTVYDIATHHSIKFQDGNGGAVTEWNGLTDLEIIIPTIKDIVQTPIEFAGTVGADGVISWNDEHKDGPQTGYLVFFTADCAEFSEAKIACEAGDMAIYDGEKWNVVSGENQVQLVGSTDADNRLTIEVGASKDVLTVEGKTLALTLDYVDLNKHVSKTTGNIETVDFGNMTVGSKYINLQKDKDVEKIIGKAETIKNAKATNLSNGEVTLTGIGDLVTDVNWGTFTPGSFQEIVKNSDARTFAVTGGSLGKTTTEDFVSEVTLGNVTFDSVTEGAEDAFALVGGITAGEGQAFVTGINNGKTEFTVVGGFVPEGEANAKFVKGLADGVTEVVTDITAGSFTFDSTASDFVTGLADGVTEVVTAVTATAKNDTSVLNGAKVENHVLTFSSVSVASGVDVQTTSKSFTKGGYTHTAPIATKKSFTMGGFTKTSDVTYKFDTDNETTYTTTSSYYKLTTPKLGVTKGGYELSNTGMVANVSANVFAVGLSGGVLPSLTASSVVKSAVVTGSVATSLDYEDITINTVASDALSITLPGAYTLVNSTSGVGVEVGAAGELAAKSATIDLTGYLKDVEIVNTKVSA